MKKTIKIVIGFIALGFFIVIAKNTFFANDNNYEKGITLISKKEYKESIPYLKLSNFQKNPEAYFALGEAYLRIDSTDNALENFIKTYEKNILDKNSENYSYLVNMIGVLYLYKDLDKSRFFLEQSKKLGNPNSKRNLQILDSLEQELIRKNSE